MCKLALVFSVIINLFSNNYSRVEKIEYENLISNSECLYLNIIINCYSRDIITLKIKSGEEYGEEYYESSLIIEGKKETRAKIPFKIKEKSFLNIIIISNNESRNLLDIDFPVYPKNNSKCDLNKNNSCKGEYPSKVIYENNKIIEKYEQISINMKNTEIISFNNLIPIKNISFYVLNFDVGDAYLYLNKKVYGLEIYYDSKYVFPLNIIKDRSTLNFEFSNDYYIDEMNGSTYEDYVINAKVDNNVLLPYIDDIYEMKLVIYESNSFDEITLKFKVITRGDLIGSNKSKYLLVRSYL